MCLPSLLWKRTVLLSKKKNMKNIPHSPHFIKTLSEHLPLGSFFIEELLVNCCHNIWEILSQCYGYRIFLDIFFSLYLLDKETQRDTYLNPCSKCILIFLDSIYSQ